MTDAQVIIKCKPHHFDLIMESLTQMRIIEQDMIDDPAVSDEDRTEHMGRVLEIDNLIRQIR